jgi:hypothetical protein
MNILKNLEKTEDQIILSAMTNGHLNPKEDEKMIKCLNAGGNNRSIIGYEPDVPVENIITNNVRYNDIDISTCKNELGPLISEKYSEHPHSCGLDYPLMVIRKAEDYEIVQGHNRFWCLENILNLSKVPVFIIEDTGTDLQKLLARIAPDTRSRNASRGYTRQDIIEQMLRVKVETNYFTNWSDEEHTRSEFERLMNKEFPNEFKAKSQRTIIFKGFYHKKATKATSIITIDDTFWDSCTNRMSYSSRWHLLPSGKKQKNSQVDYVCTKNKAIILYATDNQLQIEKYLTDFWSRWVNDESYRKAYKDYTVHMIHAIRNVPSTVVELNRSREKAKTKVEEWNKVSQACGAPKISKLIFPKQLKVGDKDVVHKLK